MQFLCKNNKLTKSQIKEQCLFGKLDINIVFDTEICIGLNEVARIIELYNSLKRIAPASKLSGNIVFYMNNVSVYDLAFIGIICLIYHTFPDINIYVNVSDKSTMNQKTFYQLAHFMASSADKNGNTIFSIIKNTNKIKLNVQNIDTYMTNAKTYLPLININNMSYQYQFENNFQEYWDGCFWSKFNIDEFNVKYEIESNTNKSINDIIYKIIKDQIVSLAKVEMTKGEYNYSYYITALYFIMLLRKLRLVKLLIKPYSHNIYDIRLKNYVEGKYTLGISNFGSADDRKYEEYVTGIITYALKAPSYYILLVSIIFENTINISQIVKSRKDLDNLIDKLDSALYFTLQLYDGIKELAKNIVEHSTNKQGAITARIFDKNRLKLIKPKEDYDYINKYNSFLDIQVIDDSDDGIISTTVRNLSKIKERFITETEISLLDKEVTDINTGKFRLQDFFIKPRIGLLHQNIRAAASLGLLILGDVLLRNDGLMKVSTCRNNETIGVAINNNKAYSSNILMPLGTCYNILIPVNVEKSLIPRATSEPFEMISSSDAYEHLLDSVILSNTDTICHNANRSDKKCILHVRIDSIKNQLELIENICLTSKCRNMINQILLLDIQEQSKEIDVSVFFRLLSDIQIRFGRRAIIILNVDSITIKRLISILHIYYNLGLSIWSNTNYVLCYYTDIDSNKEYDEYYAFIFGGEKWEDLVWINNQISKNNITQNNLLNNITQISSIKPSKGFVCSYIKNPLFTSNGQLIPFDTVIDKQGLTIFEWNTLSIMLKEI